MVRQQDRGGRTGSVTVVQRFGSALNLNVHVHILLRTGPGDVTAARPFTRLRTLSDVDVAAVELLHKWESARAEPWRSMPNHGEW